MQWCLRRASHEYAGDPYPADVEYCDDMIEEAARSLVAALDN